MSEDNPEVPCKKRKLADAENNVMEKGRLAKELLLAKYTTSQAQRMEQLLSIKRAITKDDMNLKIFQKILLDMHYARIMVEKAMTTIIEESTATGNEASTCKPAAAVGLQHKSERLRSAHSALRACSRLSEVHNYVMLAFQMKPEVVLNRAQVGGKEFALAALPDVPIKRILDYISLQDKKALREVSKGLSVRVLEVDPQMRTWRVCLMPRDYLDVADRLFKAKVKQIPNIRGFQLHFHVDVARRFVHPQFNLLNEWTSNITSLELTMDGVQKFYSLHFRNLKTLSLTKDEQFVNINRDRVMVFIGKHAPTLTHLKVERVETYLDFDFEVVGLHKLTLLNVKQSYILPFLNLGRYTKCLDTNSRSVTVFEPGDLYLPCLKTLSLRNVSGLKVLQSNAAHVQSLILSGVCNYEDKMTVPVPDLPKLHTLMFFFNCLASRPMEQVLLMIRVLAASADSLQRLAVRKMPQPYDIDFNEVTTVKLAKLTEFLASEMTQWCVDMIKQNAAHLELIVMGVPGYCNDEYDDDGDDVIEEIVCELPKLRKIVLLTPWQDRREFMSLPFYRNLVDRYSQAKVVLERRNFDSYLKTYCKQNHIHFDPYYFSF